MMEIKEDIEKISKEFMTEKKMRKKIYRKYIILFLFNTIIFLFLFILFLLFHNSLYANNSNSVICILCLLFMFALIDIFVLSKNKIPTEPSILSLNAILSMCNNKPHIVLIDDTTALIFCTFISMDSLIPVSMSITACYNYDNDIDCHKAYLVDGELTITINKNMLKENNIVFIDDDYKPLNSKGGIYYD